MKNNKGILILKFGGTSLGTPSRMRDVSKLITNKIPKIVVLSAMSGTTNHLEKYASFLYKQDKIPARELLSNLKSEYLQVINELLQSSEGQLKGKELIENHFDYLDSFNRDLFTLFEEKAVLAQGELLSTALMHFLLEEQGTPSVLLPALNFMRIDKNQEPDEYYIKENIQRELEKYPEGNLFITQGFICRDAFGEIDNLKRGGSDYTASLIGVAVKADEIQIWTDIDGFHNNDPRFVEDTHAISELSFAEAAELAYFGAKILHPTSIRPARESNIPVRLKNTLEPDSPGTLITEGTSTGGLKAVAAKDGITAIMIRSGRMLLAFGFLRKVFEIFESYRTSIDMITTSEVSVSVTIDQTDQLKDIIKDLEHYAVVETHSDQTIICVVGDLIAEKKGQASMVFNALDDVPVRMISYGSSSNNISLLISTSDKVKALNNLSKKLFQ